MTQLTDKKGEDSFEVPLKVVEKTTDALGNYQGTELIESPEGKITPEVLVIFRITVAGVASVVDVYRNDNSQEIAVVNVVGDELLITMPRTSPSDSDVSRGTRWIKDIFAYTQYGFIHLHTGDSDDRFNYFNEKGDLLPTGHKLWTREFSELINYEPFLLFLVMSVPEPRRTILVIGPYSFRTGSTLIQYGEGAGDVTVKLHRSVTISGMTYIAELVFWEV